MKLRVTQLKWEAAGIVSVVLRSPDGDRLPPWTPGAHIPVTLASGLLRQYSLCGAADDRHSYTIAVFQVSDGRGGSREIHERLRIGTLLEVGEPRNNFALVEAPAYMFLAGGIGITPIMAMIEALQRRDDPPPWRLLYGGRDRAAMAFVDRLPLTDGVVVVPQDEAGFPDIAGALAHSAPGTAVYCCGPPAMIAAVQGACDRHPQLTLHVERFTAAAGDRSAPADADTFDVELARSGITVTVRSDQSVLDAILDAKPDVDFSCTAGFCGTCETKVLSGTVDHHDELLSEDERRANTTMMICVSRSSRGAPLTLDL